MRAVIFDLDQTLLDRERSLLDFLSWQCDGMLRPYIDDQAAFIARFVELDANGTVGKDKVYSMLIDEFHLEGWSCAELLSVYESCFCGFSVPRPGALEALNALSTRYKLGLISNGMTPFQERNFRGSSGEPTPKRSSRRRPKRNETATPGGNCANSGAEQRPRLDEEAVARAS